MGKRRRRNPISCPLCGDETLEDVCSRCRITYTLGKKVQAERAAQAGDKRPYYFYAHTLRHSLNFFDKSLPDFRLQDFLAAMTGDEVPDDSVYHFRHGHRSVDSFESSIIPPEYLPESEQFTRWFRQNADRTFIRAYLTPRQADAMRNLLWCMHDVIRRAEQSGLSSGTSFVRQLAQGELSMEQVNAWHTKIEASGK